MEPRKIILLVAITLATLMLFNSYTWHWSTFTMSGFHWNWHFGNWRWSLGLGKLILIGGIVWYIMSRSRGQKAEAQ